MDGIETTRIIREEIGTEYAKTVPIIALTANAIVGNEEMFLKKGFQAFLSKPMEIIRLNAVIREWVQDKKQEKNLAQENAKENFQRGFTDRVIAGMDMRKGLERFGGDMETYMQVLRSYAQHTRPLLEQMRKVNKDNLSDYAITVHGIKGSSYGVNATALADQAEALEKAAREGNFDYVVANNEAFIEAAGNLLNTLDGVIDHEASGKIKEKKDKPDKEVLKRLLKACEAYDMDEVDAAITDIEAYDYEADDGLAAWLKESVEQMNFAQIKERLSVI